MNFTPLYAHENAQAVATPPYEVFDLQVEDNANFFVHVGGQEAVGGEYALVHNCLLKPLEQPPKSTIWILSSMEPEKFATTQGGRALANRCLRFNLEKPAPEDLRKQGIRIIKGEGLSFMTKETLTELVDNCDQEMRTLANLLQHAALYHGGLDDPPAKLSLEDMTTVLASSTAHDDVVAVRFLTALAAKKLTAALREVPNVSDIYQFLMRCTYFTRTVLLDLALSGKRHPKVWTNQHTRALTANLTQVTGDDRASMMRALAEIQNAMFETREQMQLVVDYELLISLAYRVAGTKPASRKAA